MFSLVILAASVFEISCRKTDRQTEKTPVETLPHARRGQWVNIAVNMKRNTINISVSCIYDRSADTRGS